MNFSHSGNIFITAIFLFQKFYKNSLLLSRQISKADFRKMIQFKINKIFFIDESAFAGQFLIKRE